MKRKLIYLFIALAATILPAHAQKFLNDALTLSNVSLWQQGNSLYVGMTVDMANLTIGSARSLVGSEMCIRDSLCGCGNYQEMNAQELITNDVSTEAKRLSAMSPIVAYIQPTVEVVKNRSEQYEAHLDFPVCLLYTSDAADE